jgi:hexosaminidase
MDTSALKVLVDVMEPLKIYKRHRQGVTYTFFSPLTRVVDAALPDAKKARIFRHRVAEFIKSKPNKAAAETLLKDLRLWKENHQKLLPMIEQSPVLKEIETLSEDLSRIAGIGIQAIESILANKKVEPLWLEKSKKILEAARKPRGHAELMIVSAIEQLVDVFTM